MKIHWAQVSSLKMRMDHGPLIQQTTSTVRSLSRTASISTIAMDSSIYSNSAKQGYQSIIDIAKQTKGEYSIILHNNLFLERKDAWSDFEWFIDRCHLEGITLC